MGTAKKNNAQVYEHKGLTLASYNFQECSKH